mgnify:FL=1
MEKFKVGKRDKIIHNGNEYDNYYVVGKQTFFSKELPDGREIFYDENDQETGEMT